MPTVYIDGKEYQVEPGRNMLEAVLDNGLDLPYFCWHPAMGSVGACRQCAVKVFKDQSDTKGKIVMACMTPAVEGTRISIEDPEAAEFRRYVIEWLMTNHPHDCPVCDEGGECHLQDMTTMCGQVYRRFRGRKRTHDNQNLGPFVNHEMNRCIQCWRCVRFYRDWAGGRDLNVFGSRNRVYFGRYEDGVVESEFSGNLVEICPTGVFTDKTLKRHFTRKWDLETAPSICIHCGLGCNTIPGARYGELRRIRARYNSEVNGYLICDRGRYGYEFANCGLRIGECGVRNAERGTSWEGAVRRARDFLKEANGVVGVGSPRASLEANYALKRLVGNDAFCTGLSAYEQQGAELALAILRSGPARTPSLSQIAEADAILILAADPTNEAPMLDLWVRQAMQKARLDISRALKIPDWDANAVVTALQGARGNLYIASPWRVKLQEIAAEAECLSLPEAARFAAAVSNNVRSSETSADGTAARAAADLRDAKQPLVITSVSAGEEVLKAAANLTRALHEVGKDCWLSIIVPEANTVGVAMLGGMSVQDAFGLVESGAVDTLVVVENDLSRRIDSARFESGIGKLKNLIVLDCIETATTAKADVVMPAPAYVESDGTFVNNEGRAQRFYQVFLARKELRPAWQTVQEMGGVSEWSTYEDVLRELAEEIPAFSGALEAAPPAEWRSPAGQKVARMAHRASGRTAKDADKTIREPQATDDPATPFAFSMEGDQNPVPGVLDPRFWWPGWNSVNSITKFQIEVNGPLHGGNPGKRLIEPAGGRAEAFPDPEPTLLDDGEVWIVPRPRIYGSEELSRLASGVAELAPQADITVHPETAAKLLLTDGQTVEFEAGGQTRRLVLRVDESVARDVAAVPAGFEETMGIVSPERAKVTGAK